MIEFAAVIIWLFGAGVTFGIAPFPHKGILWVILVSVLLFWPFLLGLNLVGKFIRSREG